MLLLKGPDVSFDALPAPKNKLADVRVQVMRFFNHCQQACLSSGGRFLTRLFMRQRNITGSRKTIRDSKELKRLKCR